MASKYSRVDQVLLVLGSGPGIGNAVASLFAARRFNKVALVARNKTRLVQDKETVEKAGQAANTSIEVRTWSADISDRDVLKGVLSEIDQFGQLECVFYNAARVVPSKFFDHKEEEILYDFSITNLSLYAVARWAVPKLLNLASLDKTAKPSILVTGGLLHVNPDPDYFTLSLTKTAQRNLLQTLSMTYQKDGIHIAGITVGGVVTPEEKNLNPTNIAEKAWELFDQERKDWTFEVEILQ